MTGIRLTPAFLAAVLDDLAPHRGDLDALGRLQTLLANQRRERDGSVVVAPAPDLEDALLGVLEYLIDKWGCTLAYASDIGNQRRLERFIEQASDLHAARTRRVP